MTRQEMLNAYLLEVRGRGFRPGQHDCGLFVAEWFARVTGVDHGAAWRGRYKSLRQAAEMLADAGHADHVAYVATLLDEVHPASAQLGDLAAVADTAMGIIGGDRIFVLRPDGIGHVSRLRAERAFTV